MTEKPPNPFNPSLFWDIKISEIDWEENAKFVINRILMRGGLEDWYALKEMYGLEKIKEASLSARYLDKYTLSFCSVYFNVPKEKFRCYDTKQSIQKHWNY